ARLEPQRHLLRRLDCARKQISHLVPVAERFRGIGVFGPARGTTVPARRLERVAGFLPVIRQHPGFLVQPVRAELLDGARDGGVGPPAPLRELRLVSDLLRQWMLEGILRFREESLLGEELPLPKYAQPRRQLEA